MSSTHPDNTAALLPYAIEYAAHVWPVFPLRGKNPFKGSHGLLDATTDVATVVAWWTHYPYANIGGRIPELMMMVDVDPYHGGLGTLAALIAAIDALQQRLDAADVLDASPHGLRVHPCLPELRQQRLALGRLLGQLAIPGLQAASKPKRRRDHWPNGLTAV